MLLQVRGFDPATGRYLYAVNGRFGATTGGIGGVGVPFQVGVQAQLAVGPGRIRERLRATSSHHGAGAEPAAPPDLAAGPAATTADPIAGILALRDSLHLAPAQVAQLQVISDSLTARQRLLPQSPDAGSRVAAARDNARWALERARAVLTAEQWNKLPDPVKSPESS